MKSKGDVLRDLVQSKLPHARVFWDPPPDTFFETKSCHLIAVNLANPEKRGSIHYEKGIAANPPETYADDFIAHVGPDVED